MIPIPLQSPPKVVNATVLEVALAPVTPWSVGPETMFARGGGGPGISIRFVPGIIIIGGNINVNAIPLEVRLAPNPATVPVSEGISISAAVSTLVVSIPPVTVDSLTIRFPVAAEIAVTVNTPSVVIRGTFHSVPILAVGMAPVGPTATFTGNAAIAAVVVSLDVAVPATREAFPGTSPAVRFDRMAGGPNNLRPNIADDGTGLLIPGFEPLSVGEPPVLPDLVPSINISWPQVRGRVASGEPYVRPTVTKDRPRSVVGWSRLDKAERDAMRAWLRDDVQGGAFAFDLRLDGMGTERFRFRFTSSPSIELIARGVYRIPSVEVEEIFE